MLTPEHRARLEAAITREAQALGLSPAGAMQDLQLLWLRDAAQSRHDAAQAIEAPYQVHLAKALVCHAEHDAAGVRQAGLDWLQARHQVTIGDTVFMGGWAKPRTVKVEDFALHISGAAGTADISDINIVVIGPCLSHPVKQVFSPPHHLQHISDVFYKVNRAKP